MWRFWRRRPAWRGPVAFVDRVMSDEHGVVVKGRLAEGFAFDDGGPVSAAGPMMKAFRQAEAAVGGVRIAEDRTAELLRRQAAANAQADEARLRTLLTERVARAIHDVTAERMSNASPFIAHGQAEAAVGVFVEFAVGAVAEGARVAAVRRLHWPSPERDPACDCYDGLQDCPTIAALDAR